MPRHLWLSLALTLCLPAIPLAAQSAPAPHLTLDRLYSLPSIIGTKPESPAWSPDSKRLAFLWNDAGMPFLDLWVADIPNGKPTRLTSMPHPEPPASPGTDIAKLEQQARFETDHGISSVLWTPDGKRLLFLLHGELYQLAPGKAPERLAADIPAIAQVAAAPQGNSIALETATGDLYTLSPNAIHLYTPTQPATAAEEIHWSPDGTHIAFLEADRSHMPLRGIPDYLTPETTLHEVRRPFPGEPAERRRLGIVSSTGGPILWANLGGDPQNLFYGLSWSPDSRTLLVDRSDLYIKDRRLSLVDAATGIPTLLVEERDPKNVTDQWWSAFTPDGRAIVYTSDLTASDYQVFLKPLTAGSPRALTQGDFAVFSAELSAASNTLILTTNQGRREERQAFRVSLATGQSQPITTAPGTHTPIASPDGRFLADIFSDDLTPPDLYLQPTAPGSQPRQLTHSPLPEFAQYHWVAARYVDFPNVDDHTNLHARLTLPPNFDPHRKYPAILGSVYSNTVHNQWGGRIFHPTWGLDQYLAQQGYVIINTDISGSSGYGKAFRQRIAQDYGGVDVQDLYSTARYLAQSGFVDPHRIGIWGSSYGGLLTTTSLFTHPGVFQAGVAGAPATSLYHALTGEMRTMMAPQGNEALYAKSSAFLKSGGLEDHLMLLQGMRDQVVLFKDSVVLTERLILEGKDVTLVPLPNAPHGWDTEGLAQTRYAYHKLTDYFETWLGEGPTP